MANVFIDENILQGWADTVREKTGTTDKMLPSALLQQTQTNWGTGSDITLIEGMEIPLDLAAGDQPLYAPEGYAVKSATIKKPTTLIPQNIAKGVDIAGVVGTLESGGGSSDGALKGLVFPTTIRMSASVAIGATTLSGYVSVKMPADAIHLGCYQKIWIYGLDSSGTTVGTGKSFTYQLTPGEEWTPYDTSGGYSTYRLMDYSHTIDTAENMSSSIQGSFCYFLQPSAYIENNILYVGAGAQGFLGDRTSYDSNAVYMPYAVEGIDFRGSSITKLPDYMIQNTPYLKKVWLPDTLARIDSETIHGNSLEELHFTSSTPPTGGYGWKDKLPTTCKIYVPAGSLSAYTSAANYPSASTYTYIEE